jgi:hypothetical protein
VTGRHSRAALGLLVGLVLAALVATPQASAGSTHRSTSAQQSEIELIAQTPTVARGSVFNLRLGVDRLPADGSVQLVLHDRVRSRSELAASMEGGSLRRVVFTSATPISAMPTGPDGSRRLSLSLDPAAPAGIRLSASGVYPLEVIARDVGGAPVAELVTHLIAEPPAEDESPPLAVAVLAALGEPPALQPDGTTVLDPSDIADDVALAAVVAEAEGVPATLSLVPETVDALAAGGDEQALETLRAAARDRSVLLRPYVDTSLEALAAADLAEQLDGLLARGRLVLADALGTDPDDQVWVAAPDLADDGLAALESLGVDHVVVDEEQVEPLTSGTLALSMAKPFLLAPPGERTDASPLDAFAVDPEIAARVAADEPDAVLAHHLLAELAMLWLEQPGVARGAVVPIDTSLPPEAARVLLEGLERSRIMQPVTLDELFTSVEPQLDAADSPVERALDPTAPAGISRGEARAVSDAWARLETFRGIVGLESPRTAPAVDHLLLATAAELDRGERQAHLAAALAEVEAVTGAISVTERTTITLTAREGTVPLTVRNESGVPVDVVIHLDSPKLEFPDGASIPLRLTEATTRLDLAVRARASGAFPLEVEITSPNGEIVLAGTRYTVQSTAVSGAGLVLSVGALLFLVVWWGRHWHKTRRSAKLIDSDHPAARSHAAAAQ